MISKAKTVAEYLAQLPEDRKKPIAAVRKVMRASLPKGYAETMQYGMITYVVPLKRFPAGYRGQKDVPLPYVGLASQKNHMAIHLMCTYGDAKLKKWFEVEYKKSGKKLATGQGCIPFKKIDDLALDVIGEVISKVPVETFIQNYVTIRGGRK